MALYRQVFRTENHWTLLIDGTARAGIEACLASTLAPGDKLLVPIFGRFGHLKVEIGRRLGAEVAAIETEWGRVFEPDAIEAAILRHRPQHARHQSRRYLHHHAAAAGRDRRAVPPARRAALRRLHGLARRQPVRDGRLADRRGLGRPAEMPVGPAGLVARHASTTGSPRWSTARKHVEQGIRTPGIVEGDGPIIRSNYFDLAMLMDYWSPQRLNHHTEAASMLYAARECARVVLEEGLERGFARHRLASGALRAGLEAMGLELFGDPEHRMANVTGVVIPKAIADGEKVRARAAARFRHRDRHLVRAARRQDLAHRHHGLRLPQGQCAALPDRARGGAAPQRRQAAGRSRGRCGLQGLRWRGGMKPSEGDWHDRRRRG